MGTSQAVGIRSRQQLVMLGLGWEGFGFGLRWGEGGGYSVVGICVGVGFAMCSPIASTAEG